jgi:Dynamin family
MASPSGSNSNSPSPVESERASSFTVSPEASPRQEETAPNLAAESPSDASTVLPSQSNPKISDPAPSKHDNDSSEIIPVEMNVFYNQETLKYMRIIDKYKRLEVAGIELPRVRAFHTLFMEIVTNTQLQLVIAGARSSGKSSLLENLTGLPVPITKGMGTRFPIEINLIEDPDKFQITSSIIPSRRDGQLSDVNMTRIHKLYDKPMTQVEFEDLLREVSSRS